MKNLSKLIFLCGIIILMAFSCEEENENKNGFPYNTCIKGTVIGYEQCYNNNLIQVEDYDIGTDATVPRFDDQGNVIDYIDYNNVIKSPGGRIPNGLIYFEAREYNSETDDTVVLCPHIIPYAVPVVIITKYSQTKCPE